MRIIKRMCAQALFTGILITAVGCDADDVCIDDGDSPKLTVQLRYPDSTTELLDTISFRRYQADGTFHPDSATFSNVSSFSMPVVLNEEKQMKFRVRYGNDVQIKEVINGVPTVVETIKAKTDDITLTYQSTGNRYTSKACGFGIYFQEIGITTTNNWIKSSETVTKDITDGSTTNLIVYTDPRF